MKKRGLILVVAGMLFVGSLAGGGIVAGLWGKGIMGELQNRSMTAPSYGGNRTQEATLQQNTHESTAVLSAYAIYDGNKQDFGGSENVCRESSAERFKIYEQFGMVYDADGDALYFNGKAVRWFEDYYPLGNDMQALAGMDFFNENGVVDVYAVRDLSNFVRAEDGSYDPGGKLTGLQEFTEEEFAARDIEAMKKPSLAVTTAGGPASEEEIQEMAKEYEELGLTYDAKDGQWYYNGEKVRYLRDILTSNGESLGGGNFKGILRSFGSGDGTVDVYPVRDYGRVNAQGYGTLTGIETVEVTQETSGGRADYTVYEPYGMTFDEKAGCYIYKGKIVRFFYDSAAGVGFTNFFTGTVDVEAKRDADNRLVGVEECSREVYDRHTAKYENK